MRCETAVLREIRALANERSVFRGQVISFGPEVFGPATGSTPLAFLPRPSVTRSEAQLTAALDQLLGSRGQLTRVLLGGQRD